MLSPPPDEIPVNKPTNLFFLSHSLTGFIIGNPGKKKAFACLISACRLPLRGLVTDASAVFSWRFLYEFICAGYLCRF